MNSNETNRNLAPGEQVGRAHKVGVNPLPSGVVQLAIVAAVAVAAGLLVFPI
ncbi:hypothetical protein QTH91_21035 [Variovorax dokdonensis]|uniref:Uncharacterized protein n=1 Tax=Variovorax dokdonensis TaxID=344883 RepID=A0ABT7NGI3_9BURK|nr:hypothetical protein [Variovorax dokdonensis]MDM0046990.1 hypothetical protein [Variovorax dokdonensis]